MMSTPIGRTRRSFCASVLGLEGFVVFFAVLVAAALSDLSTALVVGVGITLAIACVATAALLRHRWAYAVGTALQIALVLCGFVVPTMFFLGALFAALWVVAWQLGGRLDAEKAARGG
jgi:hypothetical protein